MPTEEYKLTGKRSIGFGDTYYRRGDTVSAEELKAVPNRQQKFFEPVDPDEDLAVAEDEISKDELLDEVIKLRREIAKQEKALQDQGSEQQEVEAEAPAEAAEEEQPASVDPELKAELNEELTVDELKQALDGAEVNYARSANKPHLLDLYIKYVHESEEE